MFREKRKKGYVDLQLSDFPGKPSVYSYIWVVVMMAKYTKTSIIDYAQCLSLKLKEIIEIKKNFQIKTDVCNESFKSYFNAY